MYQVTIILYICMLHESRYRVRYRPAGLKDRRQTHLQAGAGSMFNLAIDTASQT